MNTCSPRGRVSVKSGCGSCAVGSPWQATALETNGITDEIFSQYGVEWPSYHSQTSQDRNAVYYKQGKCMVTQHITAIKASERSLVIVRCRGYGQDGASSRPARTRASTVRLPRTGKQLALPLYASILFAHTGWEGGLQEGM